MTKYILTQLPYLKIQIKGNIPTNSPTSPPIKAIKPTTKKINTEKSKNNYINILHQSKI